MKQRKTNRPPNRPYSWRETVTISTLARRGFSGRQIGRELVPPRGEGAVRDFCRRMGFPTNGKPGAPIGNRNSCTENRRPA